MEKSKQKLTNILIVILSIIIGIVLIIIGAIGFDYDNYYQFICLPVGSVLCLFGLVYLILKIYVPYIKKKGLQIMKQVNMMPDVILCPHCNYLNNKEDKFCKKCGIKLESQIICPHCGAEIDSDNKFCGKCGGSL